MTTDATLKDAKDAKKSDKDEKSISRDPETLALASLCQALVSANRFLYVE